MVSCQKGPTRHAYAWQIGPRLAGYPRYYWYDHQHCHQEWRIHENAWNWSLYWNKVTMIQLKSTYAVLFSHSCSKTDYKGSVSQRLQISLQILWKCVISFQKLESYHHKICSCTDSTTVVVWIKIPWRSCELYSNYDLHKFRDVGFQVEMPL